MPLFRTLEEARTASKHGQSFGLRSEGSSFTVYQGTATHVTSTEGTTWTQQFAKPSKRMSTKYTALFGKIRDVSELTRANKALVSGKAGTDRQGRPLSKEAQMTASLMRVNEASTAFGSASMGVDGEDAGTGMMAETLALKWSHKQEQGRTSRLGGRRALSKLNRRFAQLDTTEKMRAQGEGGLRAKIEDSRMRAAKAARAWGKSKGKRGDDLDAYVQGKFEKHGLGEVPDAHGFRSSLKRGREEDGESEDRRSAYTGGFGGRRPRRFKSLRRARQGLRKQPEKLESAFVRPGGSQSGVYEGFTSQLAPSKGEVWDQWKLTAPDTASTKYTRLFENLEGLSDLGRANKAFVKGGSDMLQPTPGLSLWRGKPYSSEAQATAVLFRVNEPHTALGGSSMGSEESDAGLGLMAEAMAQKWKHSSRQQHLPREDRTQVSPTKALKHLTKLFPQLDSVQKLRRQGEQGLVDQIAASRIKAAKHAGRLGQAKGVPEHRLSEHVQRKFNKHGLGQVPGGWKSKLSKPKK
ncbi:hypothetical protein GCM10027285_10400 [Oleiagrimonas citrea]|uniref:Uncharacterized protein n=1 Tax=Oleiagrimonas citrea TaxID=1665687 RepID=A0A846ZLG6_9GAMM|nr:hypothetical protein [Oleiagrimonas citrea]NKZ38398.1 hypothetical protein [Oleiagrimonas citrea]